MLRGHRADLHKPTSRFLSKALWSEGVQLQLRVNTIILTFRITTQLNECRLICGRSEQLLQLSFKMDVANSFSTRFVKAKRLHLPAAPPTRLGVMQQKKGSDSASPQAVPTPFVHLCIILLKKDKAALFRIKSINSQTHLLTTAAQGNIFPYA